MVEKIIKLGLYKNFKSCGIGSGLFWGFLGGVFSLDFFKPNCSKQ